MINLIVLSIVFSVVFYGLFGLIPVFKGSRERSRLSTGNSSEEIDTGL